MRFTNKQGASRYGRYRIVPEAGVDHLPDAATKSASFLFDELAERIAKGPLAFRILVQLANDGDIVDDATIHRPEERTLLDFGAITLTEPVAVMLPSRNTLSLIPYRGSMGSILPKTL
jgi:catalase